MARNKYGEILEILEPLPDFLNLSPTLDPLFGRKDLQNVFLTSLGIIGCKRMLFALKSTIQDLTICLLLPRIAQLLLWFLREHEAYQVLQVLVNDSKVLQECEKFSYHFPCSLGKYKQISKSVALMINTGNNKRLRIVIKDIIYNVMVGYISPSFYPIVLMYFIVDGMAGLIRLIVSMLKLLYPQLKALMDLDVSDEEFIQKVKNACKNNVNIASVMKVISI